MKLSSILRLCLSAGLLSLVYPSTAQVSAVEFGRNRVQYQQFKWKYYQTANFNTYFYENGMPLSRYVSRIAEQDLPELERKVEYALQRRANLVVYNSFDHLKQSNIGLGIDWQQTGGITKLVNNKIPIYYNGDRNHLRKQVREGIVRVLMENLLFGDDLGEFAANQTLLDLPKWATEGYIAYMANNWDTELDDQLKSRLLSGRYNNFYQFAFENPQLAGHAFWRYIANTYGEGNVSYLLYLSRAYRNLNSASLRVTKKKMKEVLADFMTKESEKYYRDIARRRNVPKGQLSISEEIGKKDFIRFNPNPIPRSTTYAWTEYKRGVYRVQIVEDYYRRKELLKYGVRNVESAVNPNMPILAWDPKGTRLAVCYWQEGKTKLFVYDNFRNYKPVKVEWPDVDQVQDIKYMNDANTLLVSAMKKGQLDLFIYKLDKGTWVQLTNDVYDDMDPSFVSFPNKTGIIFSSNRPGPTAVGTDTAKVARRNNIFLMNDFANDAQRQITQLTNLKYGTARYPTQYNSYHFTFVSDENGINNRYAGFFTTERTGLDTLLFVGEDILRNPDRKEVDSVLKFWDRKRPDSVAYVSLTNDSAYSFPLSNYQSSLLETRVAGDNDLVSEVTRQGDYKFFYKLRVDETTLKRRNITAQPTAFRKQTIEQSKKETGAATLFKAEQLTAPMDTTTSLFESEFELDKKGDSLAALQLIAPVEPDVMEKARLFAYQPPKYAIDYLGASLTNTLLINRYQPYGGGGGPINLANNNPLNGMLRVGISDLMEDLKFVGGLQISPNLRDNTFMAGFQYLKKRFDYGATYFRTSSLVTGVIENQFINLRLHTNIYQGTVRYPFSETNRLQLTAGIRNDRFIVLNDIFLPNTTKIDDFSERYVLGLLEYVHDNTLNPSLNIWKGLRWRAYAEVNDKLNSQDGGNSPLMFNYGIDARHYLPIYRNIIWAVRGAFDASLGGEKVIYYLGGTDNWLSPKWNNNPPAPDQSYRFQTLAVNMRGFRQNAANGNNAMVINSEIRVPVFTSFLNKPINNAFVRNFQLVQFLDLGTAWNGNFGGIGRPSSISSQENNPVNVEIKAPGIGPFLGGYGFGARSTLLGYFLRVDAAWNMGGFFKGKPIWYFSMGFDF